MVQLENILIVGCGDIGIRVAQQWQRSGSKIIGMVRSQESAAKLKRLDIQPVIADLDRPEVFPDLVLQNTLVYYFAPPKRSGVHDDRMRNFIAGITPGNIPEQIIYISTSGVYGDCNGEWVTETRPVNPTTERSKRRFDAEQMLQSWARKNRCKSVILRVPGIYGPGRLPVERILNGEPILREEDAPFTNRIHADDLASAAVQAGRHGKDGSVYNISDGHPSSVTAYYNAVADCLSVPHPPVISREEARGTFSPTRMSFLQESRRLVNKKMLEELRVVLRYPSVEEGIQASL